MSADEFEKRFQRHVEFMLEQQARFDARQTQFEERLSRLEQVQEQQAENIDRVVETVNSAVAEMREGFKRLIAIDELTNSLIEQLTQLGVRNSRRLTAVEQRVDKLEEKTS